MDKTRFIYAKQGVAKYISHLDLMTVWRRAFNRADIKLTHSQGYNPHPYLSVALPLPVGTESTCEILDVKLETEPDVDIIDKLNVALPPGLQALQFTQNLRPLKDIIWTRVQLVVPFFTKKSINEVTCDFPDSLIVIKKSKSGIKELDVVPHICHPEFSLKNENVTFTVTIRAVDPMISPTLLVQALQLVYPDIEWISADITRLAVLDENFENFNNNGHN